MITDDHFCALYETRSKLINWLCGKGYEEYAHDIVQNVFIQVWKKRDRVVPEAAFNWIRSAVQRELKHRRREVARARDREQMLCDIHQAYPELSTFEQVCWQWNDLRAAKLRRDKERKQYE